MKQEIRFAGTVAAAKIAAIRLAQSHTKRSRVLLATHPHCLESARVLSTLPEVQTLSSARVSLLCAAIAQSAERIAAIMVEPPGDADPAFTQFFRKARELASAEGAILIWDETADTAKRSDTALRASRRIKGDIACHRLGSSAIMSARTDVFFTSHLQETP